MKRVLMLAGWLLAATCAVATPADYDRGYRDGYQDRDVRDKERRNKDYREGYKDGEAHRRAGDKGGSDYDKGFRDGYRNESLSRRELTNKDYMRGYRAGRAGRDGSARPALGQAGSTVGSATPGAPAQGLEAGMRARGFTRYSIGRKGDETHSTWINKSTNECLRAQTKAGVITSVSSAEYQQCL